MSEVKYVQKSGYNAFHKYAYATEADVLDKVRESLTKHNVFIFQSVEGITKEGELTTAQVKYTFVDGDTGDSMSVMSAGSGADKSDKGVYKAITGASKYFLLKNFMVATGDDPEATDVQGNATVGKSDKGIGVTINTATLAAPASITNTTTGLVTPATIAAEAPKKKVSFSRKNFTKTEAPATTVSADDDL